MRNSDSQCIQSLHSSSLVQSRNDYFEPDVLNKFHVCIYLSSGMLDERYAIQAHFEEQGTPIMVGGGQYAYTILGIACADTPQETRFLILDPHYVGPHDLKSILKKNGIAWKAVDMFKNGQFYNMCLPLASSTF